MVAAPWVAAQDANFNGLIDSSEGPVSPPVHQDGPVAIVDTGSSSINDFQNRLDTAGYTYVQIPMNSDYATLIQYEVVLLPISHASSCCYGTLNGLAADYHQYVNDGGCLYLGQPNPYDMGTVPITWVPFELTVDSGYVQTDCPATIVADHCMSEGLQDGDLPNPFDWAMSMGPEWEVITVGPATGYPGLITAPSGAGNVLVDFGHPSTGALCVYSDAGFAKMVDCCLGGPVPSEQTSWGRVKSMYR
jgi:hypothetical protein